MSDDMLQYHSRLYIVMSYVIKHCSNKKKNFFVAFLAFDITYPITRLTLPSSVIKRKICNRASSI